ncbi:protein kinase domain protein, partial [Ichthyophthirius multifiliis]
NTLNTEEDLISTDYTKSKTQPISSTIVSNNKPKKNIFDYKFIEAPGKKLLLGQGTFGQVRLAIDKQNNQKYAIKIIQKQILFQYCSIQNLKREIKIQKKMDHPNICKLFYYFEDKQNVYLVLEYCEQGNLYSVLKKLNKLNQNIAFRFFYQTCLGVYHLHKNGIIHRDLKPENLLIDQNGDIKLCDFGWSAEQNNSVRNTFCGTIDYMAPEMIENIPYDHKIDIWSLGILLYELLHGYTPFRGNNNSVKLNSIVNSQEIKFENFIGNDLQELICGILKKNAFQRFSLDQILQHRWMQKFYQINEINIDFILNKQNLNVIFYQQNPNNKIFDKQQQQQQIIKKQRLKSNIRSNYIDEIPNNQKYVNKRCYTNSSQNKTINDIDQEQEQIYRNSQISRDLLYIRNKNKQNNNQVSFLGKILKIFGCVNNERK